MSSPVVSPKGSGEPVRRRNVRADILAVLAIVSVLSLIDSEIVAYGIPGIVAATHLLHLPMMLAYAAIGGLSLLTLWLSISLGREIWRVEHELNEPPESG